ncbi:hypothetical protein PUN28_017547 [Cardiocondyla obscurior]|uniref:Secreted protein n=1 Tax=Cardiocondyla obscurior TaxID=286306 RepID=A0AAW2EJG0_9HYME
MVLLVYEICIGNFLATYVGNGNRCPGGGKRSFPPPIDSFISQCSFWGRRDFIAVLSSRGTWTLTPQASQCWLRAPLIPGTNRVDKTGHYFFCRTIL